MRSWTGMVAVLIASMSSLGGLGASDAVIIERISQDEFKKLLEADKVLVVDVRSADAYKSGHIPGAVSAPLNELEKHLPTLKAATKPIVTYCT